jgi:nucleoside-diphosphate-sugar epimerase
LKCLVTGAAGFIGSHLCDQLLQQGNTVVGVDSFISYYPREIKESNLAQARAHCAFSFHERDLRSDDIEDLLTACDVVFHLAAMPGLKQSWLDFDAYWTCNAAATKRLLEALQRSGNKQRRLIYVSTSSVYGKYASGDESLATKPISPYGVTKVAGEHLCRAYGDAFGIPYVILRYFSVYGPRQRPDMGYYRFIQAMLAKEPLTVFGDGKQVRGNTYVADCVAATVAALDAPLGEVYNIGGGEMVSVWDVLSKLEKISGAKPDIKQEADRPGDQRHTYADCSKAYRHFNWKPRTLLDEGLRQQWLWQSQKANQVRPQN